MRLLAFLIVLTALALLYRRAAPIPEHIAALGGVEITRTDRTTTYQLRNGMRAVVSNVKVAAGTALAGSGGPNNAGAGGSAGDACTSVDYSGGTIAWSNPTNAEGGENNTNASAALGASVVSEYLKCVDFGFALDPDEAQIIVGVLFEANKSKSAGTIVDASIRLVKDGVIGSVDRSSPATWPSGTTTKVPHGGSADLWGVELTYADINDPTFGIAIAARNNLSGTRTAYVDWIQMTVFYFPPAGGVYATGFEVGANEVDWNVTGSATVGASGAVHGSYALTTTGEVCTPASVDQHLVLDVYDIGNFTLDETVVPTIGNRTLLMRMKQGGPSAGTTGCYLEATRTLTGYTLDAYYAGTGAAHLLFGTVEKPFGIYGVELRHNIIPGTVDQVQCALYIDGALQFNVTQAMAIQECNGVTCEVDQACIGTPASIRGNPLAGTIRVDDWAVSNAGTLGVVRVEKLTPVSTSGTWNWSQAGSNSGCTGTTQWDCINDWGESPPLADPCTGTGSSVSYVERPNHTPDDHDEFNLTDIQTALSVRESVESVVYYGLACNNSTNQSTFIRPFITSGGTRDDDTDVTVGTSTTNVPLRGVWTEDPATGVAWSAASDRGTAAVNAIHQGYERDTATTNGQPAVTAAMLSVLITRPARPPDVNMHDWSQDGPQTLQVPRITLALGEDSISAGTASSYCTGGNCDLSCETDADCLAEAPGGFCSYGQKIGAIGQQCAWACETNADCEACGGAGAVCQGFKTIINQVGALVPQISTLVNIGESGARLAQAYQQVVSDGLLDDPDAAGGTLGQGFRLAKGSWGFCRGDTEKICRTNVTCPGDQTWCCADGDSCMPSSIDTHVILASYWEMFSDATVWNCNWGAQGPNMVSTGRPNCPAAASAPSGYQVARYDCTDQRECVAHTPGTGPTPTPFPISTPCADEAGCTINEECLVTTRAQEEFCDDSYGVTDARCAGYCTGHQDPARPCWGGSCSECANDPNEPCTFGSSLDPHKQCSSPCENDSNCTTDYGAGSQCLASYCTRGAYCNVDADCPSGGMCFTPDAYPIGTAYTQRGGSVFEHCGVNEVCEIVPCITSTKYCVPSCAAKTCSTDAECGVFGGLCISGRCKWCGVEGIAGPQTDSDFYRAQTKAWLAGNADFISPVGVVERNRALTTYIEATKRRQYITMYYGLTGRMGNSGTQTSPGLIFFDHARDLMAMDSSLMYLDNFHYSWMQASRAAGGDADGITADTLHLSSAGGTFNAAVIAGHLNHVFRVCENDTSQACDVGIVPCSADVDCVPPTRTTGPGTATPVPTYTPVAGACATHTPGNLGYCKCANNGDCTSGTCVTNAIIDIAGNGTPTPRPIGRCAATEMDQLAKGNELYPRRLIPASSRCGTPTPGAYQCREEITRPRCTNDPSTLCVSNTDCPGGLCTIDAVYLPCVRDSECRSNGYSPNDICAPDPTRTVGNGSTPTPTATLLAKHCMQPTPVP